MNEKITTNSAVVSAVTKAMLESSSQVSFAPKRTISYSHSLAVSKLSHVLSDMNKATLEFTSTIKKDVGNLVKIHDAIKKTDENL